MRANAPDLSNPLTPIFPPSYSNPSEKNPINRGPTSTRELMPLTPSRHPGPPNKLPQFNPHSLIPPDLLSSSRDSTTLFLGPKCTKTFQPRVDY